jgi:ABC-type bacteriocin/lantibiotic exporter with double-glycine peptidase domain
MNSKSHRFISLIKSILRILTCIIALFIYSFEVLLIGLMIAELLGIAEEIFDRR